MRIKRRSRPRKKSVDFSRLWWLVAMEATFQVHYHGVASVVDRVKRLEWGENGVMYLARCRKNARHLLSFMEVKT